MTDEPKPSAVVPTPVHQAPAPRPAPTEPVAYVQYSEPTASRPKVDVDRA